MIRLIVKDVLARYLQTNFPGMVCETTDAHEESKRRTELAFGKIHDAFGQIGLPCG